MYCIQDIPHQGSIFQTWTNKCYINCPKSKGLDFVNWFFCSLPSLMRLWLRDEGYDTFPFGLDSDRSISLLECCSSEFGVPEFTIVLLRIPYRHLGRLWRIRTPVAASHYWGTPSIPLFLEPSVFVIFMFPICFWMYAVCWKKIFDILVMQILLFLVLPLQYYTLWDIKTSF